MAAAHGYAAEGHSKGHGDSGLLSLDRTDGT